MADVTKGSFLIWRAADTTGIIGNLHVNTLIWCGTETNPIVNSDALTITTQDDIVILEKDAIVDDDGYYTGGLELTWPRGAGPIFPGIKVTNLDGGELHIWVDTPIYSQA